MTTKTGPQIKRKSVPLIGQSAESFQIGPLSPSLSDSLTNGTSIPAPAPPTPPPKEPSFMDRPSTPPSQQPKSTLSESTYSRFFPSEEKSPSHEIATSPTNDSTNDSPPPPQQPSHTSSKLQRMGYEASASASPSPYSPSTHLSTTDSSPRRPSGVFRLFKRKHNDESRTSSSNESVFSSNTRPRTPGAESMIGSLADNESTLGGQQTLKKKKSGSFWGRRKSSLNYMTGADESTSLGGGGTRNGTATPAMRSQQRAVSSGAAVAGAGNNNNNNNRGSDTVFEGAEDEEFPPRLKKKKSLTFWRRTSSMG
ncbi:MAG: hypothetical protein Q9169_007566, partial [Polycauliona sp. 2 TL-2023]